MAYRMSRLPSRFPVGTKFVIEGRKNGKDQVFTRYLEFPDGQIVQLPARPAPGKAKAVAAPRRARSR